jgi:flavin-dependent dehydrogenase
MYDAIVVGARCAGAPTAMLLARQGQKVLLVDRDKFPSDKMSTHYIHIPGVARLSRWGLYDRVMATNCPEIENITLHLGELALSPPKPVLPPDLPEYPICPRRTVLDKILIDAAVEAGAEFREGFSINSLTFDGDTVTGVKRQVNGTTVQEKAKVVIGADGLHSRVVREVEAPAYNTRPTYTFAYYNYWEGVDVDQAHIYFLLEAERGLLVFPTNDNKVCVGVGGTVDKFHEFREDIEGNYYAIVDHVESLGEQVRAAKGERFIGTAEQPNYFRKPYGPGWALVGDAGYHRDFITGLGITDAFRDAELLTEGLQRAFSGEMSFEEAGRTYETKRNEIAQPLYDVTVGLVDGSDVDAAAFMRFGAAMAAMIPSALTEGATAQ